MPPTATDEKLAEQINGLRNDLSGFRVEAAGKFASIETELAIIRRLGTWLLGGVFGLVAALVTGAATIGWSASAVVAEVRHQGERLDRVEKRLDGLEAKIDVLIRRGEAKGKGQGGE